MLQQHPHFLLTVISAPLSHPTADLALQLHQALRLLRIRRERGRQEGHLRGIDAWDIRALLTERRRETGFRERKINISPDCIVLSSEMMDYTFVSFVSDQNDVTKSCEKHSSQRKWLSVSFNPWPRWMTSPQGCRVGHHKTGPRHRNLNFLSLKKKPSFDLHIFTSFLGKCPITHANKTSEEFVWCCSELTFFTVHSFTKIFFFLKVALKLLSVLIFILQFVHNKLNKLDDYLT